jgi:hypothetical protein
VKWFFTISPRTALPMPALIPCPPHHKRIPCREPAGNHVGPSKAVLERQWWADDTCERAVDISFRWDVQRNPHGLRRRDPRASK